MSVMAFATSILCNKPANAGDAGDMSTIDLQTYADFVADYTLDRIADLTGVEADKLERLAAVHAHSDRKVMSLRTMGFNQMEEGYANHEVEAFGFYIQKGLFEEYASFGHGHDLDDFDTYSHQPGKRWLVVDGHETRWCYRAWEDPYATVDDGVQFYGMPDDRAKIPATPHEPPAACPPGHRCRTSDSELSRTISGAINSR